MSLNRLTIDDVASLSRELTAFGQREAALVASAREDVAVWKYADRTPNPLNPPGRLEVLNFDLYHTDEFVPGRPNFSDAKSDKYTCKLGYNDSGQLRYEDFGSPIIWCYDDSTVTEFKLVRAEHNAFARADLVDGIPKRSIRVTLNEVTERHFSSDGKVDTIEEHTWLRDSPSDQFVLSELSTRHEASFNSRGKLKFVVTSLIKNDVVISRVETLKLFFFNKWVERKLEA